MLKNGEVVDEELQGFNKAIPGKVEEIEVYTEFKLTVNNGPKILPERGEYLGIERCEEEKCYKLYSKKEFSTKQKNYFGDIISDAVLCRALKTIRIPKGVKLESCRVIEVGIYTSVVECIISHKEVRKKKTYALCRDNRGRFDQAGFNSEGIHRNGTIYDDQGYDREGYNVSGFNRYGLLRNGHYYNAEGINYLGMTKEETERMYSPQSTLATSSDIGSRKMKDRRNHSIKKVRTKDKQLIKLSIRGLEEEQISIKQERKKLEHKKKVVRDKEEYIGKIEQQQEAKLKELEEKQKQIEQQERQYKLVEREIEKKWKQVGVYYGEELEVNDACEQIDRGRGELQNRWEKLYKEFKFDSYIFKRVIKIFSKDEIIEIERVLSELNNLKDKRSVSRGRYRGEQEWDHVEVTLDNGHPGRIAYEVLGNSVKTVHIHNIYKHREKKIF